MKDNVLSELFKIILSRKNADKETSYTAKLFHGGLNKILKKVGEETTELVMAATKQDKEEVIYETADVLYHILVLLADQDISLSDIYQQLESRMGVSGITEKANRGKK